MGRERRHGTRVKVQVELQISELETEPTLREGDLAPRGLFVRTDTEIGEPGAVFGLRVRSQDGAVQVDVPGKVIRVERIDDLTRGPAVTGVAFQLLDYEPGKDEELRALYEYVGCFAAAEHLVEAVSVEAAWRLPKGERVRIEVPTPEGTAFIEGHARSSRRTPSGTYRTRFSVADAPVTPRPDLAGELSGMPLPTVLSILALARMTGALHVRRPLDGACVWVRDGQVVDVERGGIAVAPRAVLAELCAWTEGSFELIRQTVERPDRVGTTTTALLLDLARESDEMTRSGVQPLEPHDFQVAI